MLVWRRVTRSYRRAAQCAMCDTVARCEHVSRDQDTLPSFVTSAATHPRQPATVPSGEYILSDGRFLSQKSAASRDGKYFHI